MKLQQSKDIGIRLRRILEYIPNGVSVADIGGDHGLLSAAVASRPLSQQVVYIDRSLFAASKATELFNKLNLTNKLTVCTGDGLEPMLSRNIKSYTLVLAGMGSKTIHSILGLSEGIIPSSMDTVQAQQIILQPWPPNLLPIVATATLLRQLGWIEDQQTIDLLNKQHFLTTSFHRMTSSVQMQHVVSSQDLVDSFIRMPLTQKCLSGTLNPTEFVAWKSYLTLHQKALPVGNIIKHELMDPSDSAEGRPVDFAALIVKRNIRNEIQRQLSQFL